MSLSPSQPPRRIRLVRQGVISTGALAASPGALALMYLLARPLALLIAAITPAEALSPLAKRLSRWMPHALAAVIAFVGLLALAPSSRRGAPTVP